MKLTCDSAPLLTFLALVKLGLHRANKVVDFPFSLSDRPQELVRIEVDADAAGADEMVVRLYPSDRLLRFAATAGAGNLDDAGV